MDPNFVVSYLFDGWYQFILIFSICFLIVKWMSHNAKLPPGPVGLPFLGYVPFMGSEPSETFHKLSKKYGRIFSVRMGKVLLVVLDDYEVMKEAMEHPSSLDRANDIFSFLPHLGFGTSNGPEWQEQRRFFLRSSKEFGMGKTDWEDMIHEELKSFQDFLSTCKGQAVDIRRRLLEDLSNIVLSFIIGRRLNRSTEQDDLQIVTDYAELSFNEVKVGNATTQISVLRKIFDVLGIDNFEEKAKAVNNFVLFLKREIERQRKFLNEDNYFLNVYMQKLKEMAKSEDKNHFFTDRNLEGNMNVLFLGGSGTVYSSVVWLFALMASHPDVQQRVQNELDDALGQNGKMYYYKRNQCPYTMAVIKETLRYSSVVPMSASRSAITDIEIRGLKIPKGAQITANLRAIHRDVNYWSDPETFNPSRFLSADGKKTIPDPPSFHPFSFGRRNCPAERVAMMELLIYFSSVVQRFKISLPPGEKPKFEAVKGLVYTLKLQSLCFDERSQD